MNMILRTHASASRDAMRAAKLRPEPQAVGELLAGHGLTTEERAGILQDARVLLQDMRARSGKGGIAQSLFQEVDMGTPEGLALISLAEALLRIPDRETAEWLLQEKLAQGDWQEFRATATSSKLKALGLAADVAAKFTAIDSLLFKITGAVGLPAARNVTQQILQFMAKLFVFAPTIDAALNLAAAQKGKTRYSFDMLGEGARTMKQAAAFKESYRNAITALGRAIADHETLDQPSISVKLSALHPRFEIAQIERLRRELFPMVGELAQLAKSLNVHFTIDAEEADRLELTLDIFEHLARTPTLAGWNGLGLAIQAYSKRTPLVIAWLDNLGRDTKARFPVRLVKGAYWDAEIKHAQAEGLDDYPVYTNKAATDVSYLVCARRMLAGAHISPQFATHNAHTVAAILRMAGGKSFEFQRLHGMGDQLYETLAEKHPNVPVRIYAPVGRFKELLPYLIRRMLENTANTSFVRAALDIRQDIDVVLQDPITALEAAAPGIPLPRAVFPGRKNSNGFDMADVHTLDELSKAARSNVMVMPPLEDGWRVITNPADRRRTLGTVHDASPGAIEDAINAAATAFPAWRDTAVEQRARILERAADLYEQNATDLAGLIVAEAGRSLKDAVSEVREAVDFCRYYAMETRKQFGETRLPGITGEKNMIRLVGRGVFACISPWNFPLAIFTGQVVAALAAGNTVIAKPAQQTPLIAGVAVNLLHNAGVPKDVLHLLHGAGDVGRVITGNPRIAGVAFTGSTATARGINRTLAGRDGPIGTLIAETGGINAMFVDASALPEQVVDDVITSGFLSAGQRCSSLRHLFIQDDVAESLLEMIAGAMDGLRVGDPADPAVDVGPVIDEPARIAIEKHIESMKAKGARVIRQIAPNADAAHGTFVAPTLIELPDPTLLDKEVFGPVVHVTRWNRGQLEGMLDLVRGRGYGLTLGVHSRIAGFADQVKGKIPSGNTYINRNTVGAVVGAQPFGGCGLSGTGPKAGGPHYHLRFATEEVVTTNLTAIGGDVELLTAERQ
ncbi:MAG: bifunctional proline dehydrogenase/L-glutamate gamma-semialdehyde dehydrogenase PutA [Rhodospirillaceae bacterium]|nr:bifunctional proline dehydrogenase/L-glutamate gamma-semialdehyde dehydrogenase PutA [Rhodospirillaceae bacterium]